MESRTEFKIKSPPTDAISAVEFGPNSTQFLLVSSWDSTVRLYDIHANTMRLKYNHDLPVLDVAFQVNKKMLIPFVLLSCTIEQIVKMYLETHL